MNVNDLKINQNKLLHHYRDIISLFACKGYKVSCERWLLLLPEWFTSVDIGSLPDRVVSQ